MSHQEQMIERRARLLAQKMKARVESLRNVIAPEGERPPFTKALGDENALKFWMMHRYDPIGAQVLQNFRPQDIAELDTALAQYNEQLQLGRVGPGNGLASSD